MQEVPLLLYLELLLNLFILQMVQLMEHLRAVSLLVEAVEDLVQLLLHLQVVEALVEVLMELIVQAQEQQEQLTLEVVEVVEKITQEDQVEMAVLV